jgi:hypothetical protein
VLVEAWVEPDLEEWVASEVEPEADLELALVSPRPRGRAAGSTTVEAAVLFRIN